MKKIVTGVGVLAGYSVLPERWTRPIVGQIALPAHAATSGIALSPCSVTVVSGDQSSTAVTVHVSGSVSPPTGGLAVLIVAEESETLVTNTLADGSFQGNLTLADGPGRTKIDVLTTVSGAEGIANCTAAVAAAPVVQETKTVKAVEPQETPSAGSGVDGFNAKEVYSLQWMAVHNRSFSWLNRTGASYGGPIKFVFNGGCGELYVQNPVDDFNRGNPVAAVYFCGTKNKPEESNGTRASIFGPAGCRATSVTVYYNK